AQEPVPCAQVSQSVVDTQIVRTKPEHQAGFHDKGKPAARRGRKATGPTTGQPGCRRSRREPNRPRRSKAETPWRGGRCVWARNKGPGMQIRRFFSATIVAVLAAGLLGIVAPSA